MCFVLFLQLFYKSEILKNKKYVTFATLVKNIQSKNGLSTPNHLKFYNVEHTSFKLRSHSQIFDK